MEETLLLDDVLIDNGTIYDSVNKSVGDTMTGRFGNIMLINGDSNYSKKVRQNEVVRFFYN